MGATALGPVLTAVIQVVSLPIFLHFWGTRLYGEWLIMSAIPTYLGLSDFGFGGVAGNDMTMQVASGQKPQALGTFQSAWALTTLVSVFVAATLAVTVCALPLARWLHIEILSRRQIITIILFLSAYILLGFQWTLIEAGFRCDGNYATGALLGNLARMLESAATVVALLVGAGPVAVAVTLFAARLCGNATLSFIMKQKSPWLNYGFGCAKWSVIRHLASPAFAYSGLVAGNAFSFQGMDVLTGILLGPVAVVVFSTHRTLTRVPVQTMVVIKQSFWPELSIAYGARDWSLARKLHRYACRASLALSLGIAILLLCFGSRVLAIWTHHKVALHPSLFWWLLVAATVDSFWQTSSAVLLAGNWHQRMAVAYIMSAALSLVLAALLITKIGIAGGAIAMFMVDVIMVSYVVKASVLTVNDTMSEFILALFKLPEFRARRQESA